MKDMKKDGILVASEKLSTASTRGSAQAAAMMVPKIKSRTALKEVHVGFSLLSSSTSSP